MDRFYLQVEAVNLDQFVYDTHDISTIRGGSFLLMDAIAGLAKTPTFVNRLTPIATAASQGLFWIEDETEIGDLRREILAHLSQLTEGHATFVAAIEPDIPGNFPLILDRLQAQIRRQQWRLPTVSVPDFDPAADECFLDGWRPAVVEYRVDEDVPDAYISAATSFRREKGRAIKHELFHHLLQEEKFADNLCARDLGELALARDKGILSGKIAYIHIDGNSFGRIRRALCVAPDIRRRFDQAIQEDCRNSFLRSLLQQADAEADYRTLDSQGSEALRVEVLLWGGDEITVIVPAWKGWQLLELYYTHASSLSFDGLELSQRAAIIFAHHNAPLLQVRRVANELLAHTREEIKTSLTAALATDPAFATLDEQAKADKLLNISDHAYGNAMRYLALESFDMLGGSLSTFLESYYKGVHGQPLLIQARELASLRQTLTTLRARVARSRVLEIVRAIQAGDNKRIDQLKQQIINMVEPHDREDVKNAVAALTAAAPARWYLLADLWDYIPEWSF